MSNKLQGLFLVYDKTIHLNNIQIRQETDYNIKTTKTTSKNWMHLQQSGYRVSNQILSRIPRVLLVLVALVFLILFAINVCMSYTSNYDLEMRNCLQRYYNATHYNISYFLSREVNKNSTSPISNNLDHLFQYLGAKTVLKFQTTKLLRPGQSCVIQYDYRIRDQSNETEQEQGIQVPLFTTLGYMMSNFPLFNMNLTDSDLLKKHQITINRIILPDIRPSFRYLGMDLRTNVLQDFLYNLMKQMMEFDSIAKGRWFKYMEQLVAEIKKQEKEQRNQTNTYSNNSQTKVRPDTQAEHKPVKKLQANPPNQTNTNSQIKTIAFFELQNSTGSETANKTRQLLNNQNKNDIISKLMDPSKKGPQLQDGNQTFFTYQTKLKILQKKYLMLAHILSVTPTKTLFAKHRIMYQFQPLSKWYPTYLPTVPKINAHFSILRQVGKTLYLIHLFVILVISFVVVSLFVRYFYIFGVTVIAAIGGKRCSKYAGWLHRYTNVIKITPQRKWGSIKTILQIGFAILAMYGLYAVMTYLLVQTFQMVLSAIEILPGHPSYSISIFHTFIIIEISHYIFFRSRIAISFFYKFSMASSFLALMITSYFPFLATTSIINAHFLINIFLIVSFLLIEKTIRQDEFQSGNRPSLEKPRMLFYLGYDIDWHKSIPPIWTVFQTWYDLSFANQSEKSYIERNYELLYGRLMGVNQPQQLPDQEEQHEQSHKFKHVQMSENSE